ncbi:MAG: hypothetical protein AM325_004825 [Candidatus Thorarchaeota archaeon SMTZ1-45]|nr:MAG: hypothetical protein AM325_06590 [Candidatus Thorarchaeota archaeon SMTZ1-45]
MKVKLKIETQWLELERKSMSKLLREYEQWERETLKKAQEAVDLRSLRDVFYELGDRWEFDQATGAWLSEGEPLDAVGLILKMPGLDSSKERYVLYAVMAYSKGFTQQFDHLGDKERIIVELDKRNNRLSAWSTAGHGVMDLFPIDLPSFTSIENALQSCFIVAQPGDHALRIECPECSNTIDFFTKRLWEIAGGITSFDIKSIDVLTPRDIEEYLDFKFNRYAKAVLELDRIWRELSGGAVDKAKEKVLDKIPDHIEERDRTTLRKIEGLLHVLWFKPPLKQMFAIEKMHHELSYEPTPTEVQKTLIPYIGELAYSLTDIIEKAKYLKWKSVVERKDFSSSDIFKSLDLTQLAKEALIVALEDILREHSLAYIGYPEKATMKNKILRFLLSPLILPFRLFTSFRAFLFNMISRLLPLREKGLPNDSNIMENNESNEEDEN